MRTLIIVGLLSILLAGCKHDSVGPTPNPTPITATEKLSGVQSAAQLYRKGLRLMTIQSKDVKPDGTSELWQYQYVDTSMPPSAYWFHATSSTVVFDSNSPVGFGSAIITHRWFDSDSALSIAEQNGGTQCRSSHPHYTIEAFVGEPVVPKSTTGWWITYRFKDDNSKLLILGIDANTGTVTIIYP